MVYEITFENTGDMDLHYIELSNPLTDTSEPQTQLKVPGLVVGERIVTQWFASPSVWEDENYNPDDPWL